jgi:hypothetical protein
MKIPGTRSSELVPVLRLQPNDLIVLKAPGRDVADPSRNGAIQAQAEWLATRTGNPVVFVADDYDVLALDMDLLLKTVAKYREQRFIAVSESAIPSGPPPAGKRVVVRDFSRADDGWGLHLVLRSEPDVRDLLRDLAGEKLGLEEARGRAAELLDELDRQGGS